MCSSENGMDRVSLCNLLVYCETLIPMAEHSALLTDWKDLVGEDVKVEYFREKVKKLPRRGPRLVSFTSDPESEDEEEGEEADAVESGDCDLEWGVGFRGNGPGWRVK